MTGCFDIYVFTFSCPRSLGSEKFSFIWQCNTLINNFDDKTFCWLINPVRRCILRNFRSKNYSHKTMYSMKWKSKHVSKMRIYRWILGLIREPAICCTNSSRTACTLTCKLFMTCVFSPNRLYHQASCKMCGKSTTLMLITARTVRNREIDDHVYIASSNLICVEFSYSYLI